MINDVIKVIYSFSDDCTKEVLAITYPNLFNKQNNLVSLAAKFNHLNLLKWLNNNKYKFTSDVCFYASLNDNLEMLRWAKRSDCKWSINIVHNAIRDDNLVILKLIHEFGSFPKYNNMCVLAAEYGHLDIIIWARSVNYRCNSFVCSTAAEYGHYHIVKWYVDNVGCKWNPYVYNYALNNGNLEIIGLLEEKGCHHYRNGYEY